MRIHALLIVLICAGVTLLLRALPFAFFGGKGGVPRRVASLGQMLPPAIMPLPCPKFLDRIISIWSCRIITFRSRLL